eukprot:TRINITY_DN9509_c0_g1_i2.p1 TRINITY_DN9509_c0_g1~~TRINITY_DN9509_c0_g1_i2.p1  ORF type:complete len:227 (-),score=22.09 TRINITY_DN9509_c0_g1_i2:18-698(-)
MRCQNQYQFISFSYTHQCRPYPWQGTDMRFSGLGAERENRGPPGAASLETPVTSPQNFILSYIQPSSCNSPGKPPLPSISTLPLFRIPKPRDKTILFENNYKYRNVYKSIIRRMSFFVQENRKTMTNILLKEGFSTEEIERAYVKVTYCKDTERKNGNKKMGPQLINEAVSSVTAYTYILREVLEGMLNDWRNEKLGKIAKKNVETYRKLCETYHGEVKRRLNKSE